MLALGLAACSGQDELEPSKEASAPASRAAGLDEALAEQPKLLITELMADPDSVSDDVGEWFEIHNPGAHPVDREGWTITSANDSPHVIARSVVVAAGGYVVLGRSDAMALNGGAPVAVASPKCSRIARPPAASFTDASTLKPASTPHAGEHVEVERPLEQLGESLLAASSPSSAPRWPLPGAPRSSPPLPLGGAGAGDQRCGSRSSRREADFTSASNPLRRYLPPSAANGAQSLQRATSSRSNEWS